MRKATGSFVLVVQSGSCQESANPPTKWGCLRDSQGPHAEPAGPSHLKLRLAYSNFLQLASISVSFITFYHIVRQLQSRSKIKFIFSAVIQFSQPDENVKRSK